MPACLTATNRLCHLMNFFSLQCFLYKNLHKVAQRMGNGLESLNVLTIQQIALQLQGKKLFYRYLSQGKKCFQIAMHQLHPYLERERQVRENVEEIME
jgi:hypothetical protein